MGQLKVHLTNVHVDISVTRWIDYYYFQSLTNHNSEGLPISIKIGQNKSSKDCQTILKLC